jgi:hypothetical protein
MRTFSRAPVPALQEKEGAGNDSRDRIEWVSGAPLVRGSSVDGSRHQQAERGLGRDSNVAQAREPQFSDIRCRIEFAEHLAEHAGAAELVGDYKVAADLYRKAILALSLIANDASVVRQQDLSARLQGTEPMTTLEVRTTWGPRRT